MANSEDLLHELVGFLGPTNRSDVRAMAAKHILDMTGGDLLAAGPKARSIWETVAVPQLVRWIGDQENVAQPCRDALVNLSAQSLFFPTSPSVSNRKEFWRWLIDEVKQSGPLLVNLTSFPKGAEKIEEHIIGGTNRACAELLAACSVSKEVKVKEWCLAAVRNLSVHDGARRNLADSTPSLRLLLEVAATGSTSSQRRDAAGAIRNLLLAQDEGVVARCLSADAGGYLAAGLVLGLGVEVCPSFADLNGSIKPERNERIGMSTVLMKMFIGELAKQACADPDKDHRELLVESLLLIAGTKSGRTKLRDSKIYPAIRAYHPLETDEKISQKVFDLVDFLIAEEEESIDENLSNLATDEKTVDAAWSVD